MNLHPSMRVCGFRHVLSGPASHLSQTAAAICLAKSTSASAAARCDRAAYPRSQVCGPLFLVQRGQTTTLAAASEEGRGAAGAVLAAAAGSGWAELGGGGGGGGGGGVS